jgi:putative transposase
MPIKALRKKHNLTKQTFFRWRNKFGGMNVPDARRLKDLESENSRLKRLIAEQMLVIDGMKEIVRKKLRPRRRGASRSRCWSVGEFRNPRRAGIWA